jgi:hypothetical protein
MLGTLCYQNAANLAGAARNQAQIEGIALGRNAGLDFCDAEGSKPRCHDGGCTACWSFDASDCSNPLDGPSYP